MKPQFALDLTHTSIRLLHLAGPDEVELGFVTLDDPDFDARVHDLYRIAEERAKGRVRSLLLLPNSEILYTRVHTGPGDREARAKAVAEALVGMTPYSLDELRFDWRVDGDEAIVAAVANLTLEEAETFAVARGFNPLGFSARPENGAFKGTPDFGETELAKARKAGAPWPDRPEPPAPPAPPVTEPPVAEEEPRPETPADDAPVAEAPADPPAPVTADDQPETPVTAPEPNAPTAPDDPAPELDLFPVTPGPDDKTDSTASDDAPAAWMPKEPDTLTVSDPAPLSEAPVPTPPPAAPSQVAAAAPEALATGIARAQTDIVSDVIAPAKPAVEGTAAMDTPARKRGAGRAGPTKGRKGGARPAADTPEAKAAPSVEAPAFSSRRRGTVTDGATPPKPPQMPDPMVPPPPRPAGLPPVSELPEGTPPPPRPKIPPHLAKSVPGPKAALGSKPTTPKPAKTSRLAQLMTRLQNEPDGGAVGDTPPGKSTLPPIPDLPKTIDAKAPPRPAGPKPVVAPIHDLPLPKPPANAAKAAPDGKPADADLPDPGAASASLTPPRKASLGGPLPPPRGLSREGLDEAQAMTLFGARAEKKERSLTPVLVGIAVALLLAVAVWAGVLLLGRDPVTPANIDSSALAPAVSDPVVAALPPASAPELAPRAPLADAPDLAAPGEGSDAPRIGPPDSGPELAGNAPPGTVAPTPDPGLGPQETAQPLPAPATREEAVSRYAALGIWQIPPDPPILPETGRIDDLRLSGVSAPPELTPVNTLPAAIDLASLDVPQAMLPPAPLPAPPAVAEADTAPEVTTAAIASETASPEVAAPQPEVPAESIRVVAGAPSVTPPARPTRPARLRDIVPVNPADGPTLRPVQRPGSDAALDAATTTTAVASLVPETDETGLTPLVPVNEGDPALRPRGRPVEETTAEAAANDAPTPPRPLARPATVARAENDLGSTAILTSDDEATQAAAAAVLRVPSPPARPASFASLAAPATESATDPETATEDTAEAEANAELPPSPYAVIRSLKPEARPATLEKQVARARTQTGPAVAAGASVKPTAPTTATVAKTATDANVMNLARLNLIGVYGGNSDRRALIRLPSGRFVKVEVGDRLDGGRVATIGDNELRYVKGGRNITLQIPG